MSVEFCRTNWHFGIHIYAYIALKFMSVSKKAIGAHYVVHVTLYNEESNTKSLLVCHLFISQVRAAINAAARLTGSNLSALRTRALGFEAFRDVAPTKGHRARVEDPAWNVQRRDIVHRHQGSFHDLHL